MRNLILGAAAALVAVLAMPTVASANTGGSVGFLYAGLDQDNNPTKDNVVAFDGVILTDLNNGWLVQANMTATDADAYNSSFATSAFEIHAIYDFGAVAVGGFTGLFEDGFGNGYLSLGVEAAGDIGPVHVAGSVSTHDNRNGNNSDIDNMGVSAGMNVLPNLNLSVSGSWSDFGGANGEVSSYGIAASYDIPNTDFSVGVGYRTFETDFANFDMDAIGVSLRWKFGEDMDGYMPGADGLIGDAIALY
jgi:hypothetical protein